MSLLMKRIPFGEFVGFLEMFQSRNLSLGLMGRNSFVAKSADRVEFIFFNKPFFQICLRTMLLAKTCFDTS